MTKRYTKEWKEKISVSAKKFWETNELTDETRKKLSEAAKRGNINRVYKLKSLPELKSEQQVRNRLFEKRGRKCEKCGWCEKNTFYNIIPVQVNHKNGNPEDNREENLEILCPNCHSLAKFYMNFGKRRATKPNPRTLKRYKSWSNKIYDSDD